MALISIKTIFKKLFENKLSQQAKELEEKTAELERMNQLMIGRELRMIEFKREIKELYKRLGIEQSQKAPEAKLVDFENTNISLEDTKKAMLNLLEDIQEQKKRAEEGKARYEALLSNIGDGMLATDKQGAIIMINASAQAMLQWTKEELLGNKIDKILPVAVQVENPFMRVLTTGQKMISSTVGKDNYYFVRKDKTTFPIFMTATPVVVNNQIIGSILIFHDATREKEVDRMKTEFISLASHQLRTPLSAIRWFTEMLISGDAGQLNKEQAEFATNVSDSTQRMIELVNSLLNISRIESGRIIIDPRPTDVAKLVQGIVNDLKVKIDEKKQAFIVSVHRDLPLINLDPQLIGQVYLNLLTNAIKYTPISGEISVFVSRKGNELVSQVSDNGLGIPLPQQKRVFQKFFRADNVVKIIADGTGLGLYLVKAIIESSGGRIWFESKEGQGTTFFFSLPITGMIAKKGEVTLTLA